MKALVLAAGFGTRLKPYTESLPKPLFPLNGETFLERTLRQLVNGGCSAVMVNTHHLHEQVEAFVKSRRFGVPVSTCYEPQILETGGAVRNVRHFFDDGPFMVVNGDIITDMDYAGVFAFHKNHGGPVTLVLHDFPEFNNVTVDTDNRVLGFHLKDTPASAASVLAFTGVQVIDPGVIDLIPKGPSSIIDLYRRLIAEKTPVKGLVLKAPYWRDMGSPDKYSTVCTEATAPTLFRMIFDRKTVEPVSVRHLSGDGSDRAFYRLENQGDSMILADHGITMNAPVCEAASFERIGRHLLSKGVPVPKIYWGDRFAGHVYLEDLGDIHLETVVKQSGLAEAIPLYKEVLKNLARMSVKGVKGFKTEWTFQTGRYDKALIMERECRYFIDAFVKGYLGLETDAAEYAEEFSILADHALMYACDGFMHRDFQSRNIMVKGGRCWFIDFQSGRLGPVQYDLASLLIDPYTALPRELQDKLTSEFIAFYKDLKSVDEPEFMESYRYLKITRNLQMLGAFGFLSRVKGKTQFEAHIPKAVENLKHHISRIDDKLFKKLKKTVDKI